MYNGTVRDLVSGVLYGINTTVFAYGATGSGKTYTMVRAIRLGHESLKSGSWSVVLSG